MLSAVAVGQENPDSIGLITQEPILSKDNAIIFADYANPEKANSYLVMCPGYGANRELYTNSPSAAVTLLFNSSVEDLAHMVRQNEEAWPTDNSYFGYGNNGFITPEGAVKPQYTFRDWNNEAARLLEESAETLKGADSQNAVMLQNIKKFSLDFCFSGS